MSRNLRILAGPNALKSIRTDGLSAERIKVVPGAAGGPKWLVLGRMDRVIFGEWFEERQTTVDIIGASSGAWRFAAAAQANPIKALKRLEDTYISYRFDIGDSARRIKDQCAEMVSIILGETGATEIIDNPKVRAHLMTARSTALTCNEGKIGLGLPSALAFFANAVSRRSLGLFFRRALFSDPRSNRLFNWDDGLPTETHPLTSNNLAAALLASGAIPIVTEGVANIEGAKPGIYRDGGVTDYQFASPMLADKEDGIVFYPHYAPSVMPGWLDKHLSWRRTAPSRLRKTVILTPTPDFVAKLPGAKIQVRQDFVNMAAEERIPIWRKAAAESERLADELRNIIEKDAWNDAVEPLS